jgi:hypothetical protein
MRHNPARPNVPTVAPLASAYRAKRGNGAGGSLHIVLDDGNLETSSVLFCLNWAMDRGDRDGAALALILLAMSPTQRGRVRR